MNIPAASRVSQISTVNVITRLDRAIQKKEYGFPGHPPKADRE